MFDERDIYGVYPKRRDNACGAVRLNCFHIDPEGLLYACSHDIGIKKESLGDIKTGYDFNENYTKWLLVEPTGKCLKCKFLPVCQGSCPHDLFNKGDTNCFSWTIDYKSRLKLAYRDHQIKKERDVAVAESASF